MSVRSTCKVRNACPKEGRFPSLIGRRPPPWHRPNESADGSALCQWPFGSGAPSTPPRSWLHPAPPFLPLQSKSRTLGDVRATTSRFAAFKGRVQYQQNQNMSWVWIFFPRLLCKRAMAPFGKDYKVSASKGRKRNGGINAKSGKPRSEPRSLARNRPARRLPGTGSGRWLHASQNLILGHRLTVDVKQRRCWTRVRSKSTKSSPPPPS